MQTGKVAPVKQKQRKTKTEKKTAKAVKSVARNTSLAKVVWQHVAVLARQREKLITLRCTDPLKKPSQLLAGGYLVPQKGAYREPLRITTPLERKELETEEDVLRAALAEVEEKRFAEQIAFAKSILLGAGGGLGLRFTIRLANQQPIGTNSATGKYFAFFNGGIAYAFANLSNATEFSSLDVLFDEVFIHKLEMHFVARNKYVPYVAVGNAQTCMANIHVIPHNDPPYADGATLVQTAAVTTQHKLFDIGENMTFVAHNPTKFSWDDDVMDQTTTQAGMGWCAFPQVATKYGGNVYLALFVPTAAAGSNTAFPTSWPLGDMIVYFDISVRARA